MKLTALLGSACILLSAVHAFCQMRSGENVIINEKISNDLYVAGSNVTVNAPIDGDLIVTGGTVTINDTVTQDIMVAGGTVMINGYVKDDVRCAGGTVRFSKNVEGDVVAAGSNITIEKGVSILGDLYIAGGEVVLDGDVNGQIKSASGTLTLNGKAGKDIDCRGGTLIMNGTVAGTSILAAREIQLGPQAQFNNDVRYWNSHESLDFGNTIHNGKATLDSSLKMETGKWHYLGFGSLLMGLWYLGTALIMIILIQYLFKATFSKAANIIKNASLKSLGFGVLFLIVVPVAIIVCFITIVGLPVAILLMITFITVIILATVIVALLIAHWINNTNYNSSWSSRKIILVAFGIFVVLKLASLTPFVGPLIMFLLACMGFGGILQSVRWRRNQMVAGT